MGLIEVLPRMWDASWRARAGIPRLEDAELTKEGVTFETRGNQTVSGTVSSNLEGGTESMRHKHRLPKGWTRPPPQPPLLLSTLRHSSFATRRISRPRRVRNPRGLTSDNITAATTQPGTPLFHTHNDSKTLFSTITHNAGPIDNHIRRQVED